MSIVNIFSFSFIALFSITNVAHAYLDPGASSMLIQVVIAAGVGGMAYCRTIVNKIKSIFNKKDIKNKKNKK